MMKYALAWLPMVVIAVANGALRQGWYGRHMSELRAHQLSTLTGIALFAIYIGAVMRVWRPRSQAQAFRIGLLWLALTVAFEFIAGRWLFGAPWRKLLHDYDIFAGRLWIVLLIWITIAPAAFHRLWK
jgi:hypothetical protein